MAETLKTIIVITYVSLSVTAEVDWCSAKMECKGQKHTMCMYQPKTETTECKGLIDTQTPAGRQRLLDLHNEYRNKLAGGEMAGWPKAANMRQMSWDSEIESIALRWALQCIPGHDRCRRTQKFQAVGQNYGMQASTAQYPESKACFDGWVDEVQLIGNPEAMLRHFKGGSWGHFTQVVWASSHKLGCAEIHYVSGSFKTTVAMCNYGPSGNMVSAPMYEEGKPASKCPAKTSPSKKYPNLCAVAEDDSTPGGGRGGGAGESARHWDIGEAGHEGNKHGTNGGGAGSGHGADEDVGDGNGGVKIVVVSSKHIRHEDGAPNVVKVGGDVDSSKDATGGSKGGGGDEAKEDQKVGDSGNSNPAPNPKPKSPPDKSDQSTFGPCRCGVDSNDKSRSNSAPRHKPWSPLHMISIILILILQSKLSSPYLYALYFWLATFEVSIFASYPITNTFC